MAAYQINSLKLEADAERVRDFFLSGGAFDDQRFTPGEIEYFNVNPFLSIHLDHVCFWFAENSAGEVIAACSVTENEMRTGGYLLEYIAVNKEYRRFGLATALFEKVLEFVRERGGRYILTFSCDLPEYANIKLMFAKLGFEKVGYWPDYYFEGEGRIAFLKKL